MKQFFESYGGVALGILALLVLIAMITPVGNIIKTSLQGTTNKFASSMNGQLDDAMVATAEAQESAAKTPIDLTNINKNGVVGDFSAKGNLVEINGTQYRVLEVNGSQAKVMSMENIGNSTFNTSSVTATFDSYTGQKYYDSKLDRAMTNYYNMLSPSIQNAIIEQNINQSMYFYDTGTNSVANFSSWWKSYLTNADISGNEYHLSRVTNINVGNKKIYVLDIDDIIAYLGTSSTAKDVNEMFFNVRRSVTSLVWLRSSDSRHTYYSFVLNGSNGILNSTHINNLCEVRPAFVIDLSLL